MGSLTQRLKARQFCEEISTFKMQQETENVVNSHLTEMVRVQEMRNSKMGNWGGKEKHSGKMEWRKRGRYDYILYPLPFPALPFWPRSHSEEQWAQKLVPNEPLNSHTVGGSTSFKRLHSYIVLLDRHGRIEFAGGCQKVSRPGEKSRTSFTGPNRAGGKLLYSALPSLSPSGSIRVRLRLHE